LPYDILFLFAGEKVQKETAEILYWRSKDKRTCIKLTVLYNFIFYIIIKSYRKLTTLREFKAPVLIISAR